MTTYAETRIPTLPTSLLDVAREVHAEVVNPEFESWLDAEQNRLNKENPVLGTYLETTLPVIVRTPELQNGGAPGAQAYRNGFLYAYRTARTFAERTGIELPRFVNNDHLKASIQTPVPPELQSACSQDVFRYVFAAHAEFTSVVDGFNAHPAREGAGIVFILFRDALQQR